MTAAEADICLSACARRIWLRWLQMVQVVAAICYMVASRVASLVAWWQWFVWSLSCSRERRSVAQEAIERLFPELVAVGGLCSRRMLYGSRNGSCSPHSQWFKTVGGLIVA